MQTKGYALNVLKILLFLLAVPIFLSAQSDVFNITAENLKDGNRVDLNKAGWKYQSGDDTNWASPEFDDSHWNHLPGSSNEINKLTSRDWRGYGWFRLRLKTDESLRGKILGLSLIQTLSASEIYFDGILIRSFGETQGELGNRNLVNINSTMFAVPTGEQTEHLLAVRYRSIVEDPDTAFAQWIYNAGGGKGFYLGITDINDAAGRREQSLRSNAAATATRAAVYLVVGLLHLLLFWFYPPQRANLYFGIFAALTAINTFIGYLQSTNGAAGLSAFIAFRALSRFTFLLYSWALLMFLYRAFLPRTPRYSYYMVGIWTLTNFLAFLFSPSTIVNVMFGAMTVWFIAECLRVMVIAVRQHIEGAWIVALGILTALIGPIRYLYLTAGFVISNEIDQYLGYLSSYGLLAAVSIYLARNFAHTSKNLETQLSQIKKLSARELEHQRTEAELRLKHEQERAENERRAKELEEARQLQLSMLPKHLPRLPNLEIAAYMKPATEVGGDYYDFHVASDGTLTVAVGDATGHGLKANSMVTATKGLFNAFAGENNIPQIFRQTSSALKKMNLRGLYMAMAMLKIKGNHLTISAAGMPSAFIYRFATKQVEEVIIKAMPLGSISNFAYQQHELNLSTGDCIIVMTDGFPEMFNEQNEMLGYEKAAGLLKEVADLSPQEIIKRFAETGETWAGKRPPDDDVTFVVLKVKEQSGAISLN